VKSKVDNGVDGHRALQHLLGVVDEHHGGGVSPIAPAKCADPQWIDELQVVPQVSIEYKALNGHISYKPTYFRLT